MAEAETTDARLQLKRLSASYQTCKAERDEAVALLRRRAEQDEFGIFDEHDTLDEDTDAFLAKIEE